MTNYCSVLLPFNIMLQTLAQREVQSETTENWQNIFYKAKGDPVLTFKRTSNGTWSVYFNVYSQFQPKWMIFTILLEITLTKIPNFVQSD